jgi:hypothetical protein
LHISVGKDMGEDNAGVDAKREGEKERKRVGKFAL